MVETTAVIFGIIFLAVGILGFVPGITTNDHVARHLYGEPST